MMLLLLSIGFSPSGVASHIKGGEITYVVSGLKVTITVTGYGEAAGVAWGQGILQFGDGSEVGFSTEDWDHRTLPEDATTQENVLVIEHTYPSPGLYVISYSEQNRNAGILNVSNGNSLNIPFYIESTVVIDPGASANNSPLFNNAPVDIATPHQKFTHNAWTIDPDGDSLSYKIVIPQEGRDQPVPGYKLPNHLSFNGTTENGNLSATFTLNPFTGDLIWDSPGVTGEFNVAMQVSEWRKIDNEWIWLGAVTRDMQIIVEEGEILRPILAVPADSCISAGKTYRFFITTDDNEEDSILVQGFSELFYKKDNTGPTPLDGTIALVKEDSAYYFEWTADESYARSWPYTIYIKVTDDKLVTYQSFRVGFDCTVLRITEEDVVTGYEEIVKKNFKLYPNPAKDRVRLEILNQSKMQVYLIDQRGKYLMKDWIHPNDNFLELDISSISPGIYLLILRNDKETLQQKIVVK